MAEVRTTEPSRRLPPSGSLVERLRSGAKYHLSLLYLRLLRYSDRRVGLVLMYHGIGPRQGDPRTELSPPLHQDVFAGQLRHLVKHHRVVAARDIQAAALNRRRGEPFPVALTFDDDCRSHLEAAAPLMRRAGVSATFFLNGLALEKPRSYWWERLERALAGGASWEELLPPAVYAAAREAAQGEPEALHVSLAVQAMAVDDRREWADALCDRVGPDPADANLRASEIRQLREQGFDVGFHGANHEPLALLDESSIARELEDRRGAVEAAAGVEARLVAYPYGSVDARVASIARDYGYLCGFSVREEAVGADSDPLCLGRMDGNIDSVSMFGRRVVRVLRSA